MILKIPVKHSNCTRLHLLPRVQKLLYGNVYYLFLYYLQCAHDLPGTAQIVKKGFSSSEMDHNRKTGIMFSLHHNLQTSMKKTPSRPNIQSNRKVWGNFMFQLPYKTLMMMIVYGGTL